MAYLLLLCTVLLICVQDVVAQTDHKGKEFYFAVMSVQRRYGCLYVSCDRPTKGVVYLYRTNTLTDTIHFSLTPPQRTIPIKIDAERVELQGGALGDATYFKDNLIPRKRSVYVRADHDIELSYLNDTYQDSDRTLLYPLHSYGKDYTINAPPGSHHYNIGNNFQRHLYSQCAIVATENNTQISIESPVNLIGDNERNITARLQKGESYLIQARPSPTDTTPDLTGLRITSSSPISVMSGAYLSLGKGYLKIPNDVFEQLLPSNLYAQHYIIIDPASSPQEDDLGPNFYKIVAMSDTTTVYVNGNKIGKLRRGEFRTLSMETYSLVYATNPIGVILLRRSSANEKTTIESTFGDPFMIDISPQEYWLSSYNVFTALSKEFDETLIFPNIFPYNHIDIVVPTAALNQMKLNGKVINQNLFKSLPVFPSAGFCQGLSYARITRGPDSLQLDCNVPFGISCYGYGILNAYGYVPGRSMNNVSLSHPQVNTIFSDTVVCPGTQVQLQASGGDGTFRWSPKEGLSCTDCPSPTVTAIKDITYTVQSNDYFGCPTLSQKITVRMRQATVKASEDLGICAGDSVQLTVNEGSIYSWTPSNTLSCSDCRSPYARPMARQTYYVTMTDKYGCTGIDSVTVSVGKPTADAGRDTSICAGSSVQMRARGGNYYRWETSPDVSCSDCADPIISPKQSQYYRVRSFISANCYADDSVFITVEQATANIIAPKVRYCENDSIQLRVEGGTRVQWRGAGITCADCRDQRFIAPQSGYYYAEITTDNNCTAQDSVYITINKPQITVSADTTICRGTSANVWARGNGRFIWSPPQGLSCTECSSPSASPTESTEYTVSLYDADNCIASEKVWVYVDSCAIKKQDTITLMASLDCDNISTEKIYTHISDIPLTVQSPIFVRGNNNAFLVEYSVPAGTQLSRNENCIITITMKEKTAGNYSAEYIIGEGASTMLVLSIEGKYEEKSANIRPHDTTDIIAGSRIPVRIFMENSQSGLQDVVTTISYPSRFMKYTSQSLRSMGGGIFSVEKTEEKEGMEYIIIRGKGIENNSSEQEIVRFEADIYLGDSTSFTVLTSTQTPNECYRIAPSKATISMGGCFIDARTVTTGQPYMMTSRIENDMLIIDYTAGLRGSTECVLLNSLGENVATVYNQRDEQGKYRIDYPVAGMANGYYILVFRSGIYQTSHVVNLMR